MITGSHNTMSYLEPTDKWQKIRNLFTRCQKKTIEEQYECGARLFDIRLFINKNGKACFKCKNIIYYIFSFYEVFQFLNKKGDCAVRLTLEETKRDNRRDNIGKIEERFVWHCRTLEEIYRNIKFFGGYRQFDGKELFKFRYRMVKEYRLLDFV